MNIQMLHWLFCFFKSQSSLPKYRRCANHRVNDRRLYPAGKKEKKMKKAGWFFACKEKKGKTYETTRTPDAFARVIELCSRQYGAAVK